MTFTCVLRRSLNHSRGCRYQARGRLIIPARVLFRRESKHLMHIFRWDLICCEAAGRKVPFSITKVFKEWNLASFWPLCAMGRQPCWRSHTEVSYCSYGFGVVIRRDLHKVSLPFILACDNLRGMVKNLPLLRSAGNNGRPWVHAVMCDNIYNICMIIHASTL